MDGSAAALHAFGVPAQPRRLVRQLRVDRPALVLGSTQSLEVADAVACEAAGVEVVRRSSGGGAVLLDPDETLWVDVVVPAGDPHWEADVGRAFWWLGAVWAAAVGDGATVHKGPPVVSDWSSLVCFAGLGSGEVTVGGRKAVGMSQRRTRAGALFQCAVPVVWRPERLAGLLALEPDQRERLAADLAGAVAPSALEVGPAFLEALEALPDQA